MLFPFRSAASSLGPPAGDYNFSGIEWDVLCVWIMVMTVFLNSLKNF